MAQSTVGSIRFNPRSNWVSGTSYLVDDVVLYKNNVYVCKVANSSTTVPSLNTSQWDMTGGGTYHAGEWSSGTSYAVGDIVTYTTTPAYNSHYNYVERSTYICTTAGTNQNPATQTSYWKKIASGMGRDKYAFLCGINEGYVPTHTSVWDSYTGHTVGPLDSFGEYKTPGTHLVGNGHIQYVNRRGGLVHLGGNRNYYGGIGLDNNPSIVAGEAQFCHNSWFDGSLPTSPTTAAPKIVQVEGDMYGSCLVLFDNGEVHHSGYNGHGQNGAGVTTNYYNFVQCGYANINRTGATTVLRDKKVIRIASSADGTADTHSCYALVRNSDDSRELYAWGYNGYGQLGQGNTTDYYVPTLVSFDQATNGKIIGVWATGGNYAQCFFLTTQGKMYAMGYNGNGNLGVNDTTNKSSPTLVKNWGTTTTKIKKFNTAGGGNSGSTTSMLVIAANNTLWTWGYNGYGQLGHGHTYNVTYPLEVYTAGYSGVSATVTTANPGTPSGTKLTNVWNAWHYGSQYGSMAVTRGSSDSSNTLYTCGYNGYYQLSVAQATTTNYSTLQTTQMRSGTTVTNVVDVASNTGSSSYTNFAVKRTDGEWYFCGYSNNGGAWAVGTTDTYNQRQQTDPDFISGNYRLKNNLMYAEQNPPAYKSYWKYLPFGYSSNKFAMYINLYNGKVYTSGYGNDNNLYNDYRGHYVNTMTKIKGT